MLWHVISVLARRGREFGRTSGVSPHPSRYGVEPLEGRVLFTTTLPPGFEETVWVQGFNTPTAQAFAPDGRLFVTEKAGNVRVVQPDGTLLTTPFVTVTPETTQDRGLVGLILDPNFQNNGYLYLWWTKSDASGTRDRLSRFTRSATNPNVADPNSELVLLESPITTNVHTGGAMGFGADGMLYLGVGDGGVATSAQDLGDLRGKVLRLNVADPANLVPADNPFAGQPGRRPEIWASGFRNPFTGAMKPGTNTFFVNDVGGEQWEEVDQVQRGGNFGWPTVEGATTAPGFVNPVYSYAHAGLPTSSAAVTGGTFYTGTQFPAEYRGDYFFGDYLNRFTRRLDTGGGTNAPADFGADVDAALDYDVGPDGSLYYLSAFGFGFNGENRPVYKIAWVGTGTNRPPTAVASATGPTSGLPPLTVNFSGAGSSDPDGDALGYRWTFGDDTTGTGQTASHTYSAAGTYRATLTVDDGRGGTATSAPVTVTVGNRAPIGTILSPAATLTYAADDTISFSGSATDPEDGALPASAFSWTVLLLHNDHTHVVTGPLTGVTSGSFKVPTAGHVDANQGYRVVLTVTDAGGLTSQTTRDFTPKVANVSLASTPAGLSLALDGTPRAAGVAVPGLVGATRTLSAAPTQTLNGVTYQFVSWSDGGAATHTVSVPATASQYVAAYRAAPVVGTPVAFAPVADAYVQDGASAGRNFGGSLELDVKRASAAGTGLTREALLKFDTASLGGTIASAKLRLFGRLNDPAATVSVVTDVYGTGTSWQEKQVTWNTRPAANGTKIASATIIATGKWYEIDVTNYVKAERAAGRNVVGLLLRNPNVSSPYVAFNAREAASNRPQLVLTPQSSTPAPQQAVASFTLFNADTDKPIAGFDPFTDGAALDVAKLGTRNFTVRANTNPVKVGSVWFGLDSNAKYHLENAGPYTLAGESGADLKPWTPTLGAHTLTATPYTLSAGGGAAGKALTVRFTVIDSSKPPAQAPFGGAPAAVPGTIQAENFDDGGEGVAYHDTDAANQAGAYRTTGVDVEATGDTGGGFDVGYLKAGEWLEYTVNVAAAGRYDLSVRVAADAGYGGTFHLEVDGADQTGPITLPATGGWQAWATVGRGGINLTAGRHVLRLAVDSSNSGGDVGNVNWLKLTAAAPTTTTVNWAQRADAPFARDEAQGATVGGKLYVFGGFYSSAFLATTRVDVYDPIANQWTTRGPMPEALTHTTAVYDGTYVWLVGGYVGNDPGPGTNHVWKYDPATDAWTRGPDLPAARGAGAAALLGRELHFFGGMNQARTTEQPEHWVLNVDDPGAAWAARAPLPVAHNHLGAAAVGGKVYAIGGQTGEVTGAIDTAQVYAYTPATNTWARVADLPAPRSHFNAAAFVRNGRIVVAGGESAHNAPESDVWEYDPAAGRWSSLTPLPGRRRGAVAQWVANRIVVTGGYDGTAHQTTTWGGT